MRIEAHAAPLVLQPVLRSIRAETPTFAGNADATHRAGPLVVVLLDLLSVLAALILVGPLWLWLDGRLGTGASMLTPLRTELPYVGLYLLAFTTYGSYRRDRRRLRHDGFVEVNHLFHSCAAGALATIVASAAMQRWANWRPVHPLEAVLVGGGSFFLVGCSRSLRAMLQGRRGVVRARIIVVGADVMANRIACRLDACDDLRVVGFVDDVTGAPNASPVLGSLAELPAVCETYAVDRVVVAFPQLPGPELADVLRCLPSNISVSVVPRLFELITPRSCNEEIHGITLVDIAPPSIGVGQRFMKRALDIVGSVGLLLVTAPALAAVAVAIRVSSPGPALFRQTRFGRDTKPFTVYKFRTMTTGAEVDADSIRGQIDLDGPLLKVKADPRVTRVGRFLRATSLDELPQLFNVLRGDMSLVGPRPFVPEEAEQIDGWAARRFEVRPGMTGLWQVSGRSDLPYDDLRRLDYAYVASWSFWWDLRILAKTPGTVVSRRGAY